MKTKTTTVAVAILIAAALCLPHPGYAHGKHDKEEILKLGSFLTKLAGKVTARVRFGGIRDEVTGEMIWSSIKVDDKELADRFDNYIVKIKREGELSSTLVCDAEGKQALLEDSGCTARLDGRIFESTGPHPCEFTLDLATVCPAPSK